MKKSFVPLFILLATVILLSACSPKAEQPVAQAAAVEANDLIVEGRIYPANSLAQSFNIPGEVAEVLVKDGDIVEAGQVLARLAGSPEQQAALARARQEVLAAEQALDEMEAAADLNRAQAKLALITAEEELELAQDRYDADDSDEKKAALDEALAKFAQAEQRSQELALNGGVDPDQHDALIAQYASAKASLVSVEAALAAHELKSSLAGTVVDLTLQVGEKVTAGQPVITVADFSQWLVKTDNLTEMDVVAVVVGQQVEVVLDAMPDMTLSGEVTHINSVYEEKRGDITYTVTAMLKQTEPRIRWGMTAAVQFIP